MSVEKGHTKEDGGQCPPYPPRPRKSRLESLHSNKREEQAGKPALQRTDSWRSRPGRFINHGMSSTTPAPAAAKPRILTGDTPTGKLHLGHYVGSVENRLALQEQYDCYFLIANKHAFTTRADKPAEIRQSVIDIATDWLAVGIDPDRSTMFIQSEVPAIDELTFFFAMLIPFNRVMRNPTLAQEIKDKDLGDKYPFGFPLYAVGQCADILAFRPRTGAGGGGPTAAPGADPRSRPQVRPALLRRRSAHRRQGLRQSRRPFSGHRAQARPGETAGRPRRPKRRGAICSR